MGVRNLRSVDGDTGAIPLAAMTASARFGAIRFPTPRGWSLFNPSIARDGEGFAAVVRSSNYVRTAVGFDVNDAHDIVRTRNYLVHLDPDLAVERVTPIRDETDAPVDLAVPFRGFEDCRLFRYRDRWHVTATARDRNAGGVAQIGLMTLEDGALQDLRLLSDPATGVDEKNWMPVVHDDRLMFVYWTGPTTVLRYDDERRGVSIAGRRGAPVVASTFHGGSQGVAIDEGYLFVVHESIDLGNWTWRYPHRFMVMDREFRLLAFSPRFSFRRSGVEFCAGLARHGDHVVVSYGVEDRQAELVRVPLAEVVDCLEEVGHVGPLQMPNPLDEDIVRFTRS